jgi:uncharacterized protein with von Willebrand factor type A (vWA) domain
MLPQSGLPPSGTGKLAENVLHFARLLRAAGLPVGTDRALLALQALQVAGVPSRAELHDVLQSCLISRVEHRLLFEQAFHVFWRDPDLLAEALRMLLPSITVGRQPQGHGARRLLDALLPGERSPGRPSEPLERPATPGEGGWSDRERLRKLDFESMSAAEYRAAQRCVTALEPLLARMVMRREQPHRHGPRLDMRRLLRDCGRHGGDLAELPHRVPRTRTEPLCVIVDISGSMARYSRMFLHFMHALMNAARAHDLRVSAFVFGTRLTHITSQLRSHDPDAAVARVTQRVADWSGGTRIGTCLREFNQHWVRRLPLASATVLLVTDGLEHAQIELLAEQAQRLSRSCRRILWLNPLLRYAAFEPKARGIRALLPHIQRMLPVHNIESLQQLLRALETAAEPTVRARRPTRRSLRAGAATHRPRDVLAPRA